VKFDESPAEPVAGAPAQTPSPPTFTLPAGSAFKLLFTQPVDTATAAAGDRIRAKLSEAIVDASSKRVLAPAGAEIVARILRLEHFPVSPESVRTQVKLETINVGGTNLTFSPAMNWVAQKPADLPTPGELFCDPVHPTFNTDACCIRHKLGRSTCCRIPT